MRERISLIILVLILSYNSASSQIQFESSFDYSASLTKLETEGDKYFIMDVEGKQCRLYNPDYSLWKTINFTIPNNQWLTDIKFVSQHVFNSDDLVEMLIIYYQYIETSNSYYYIYTAQVVNENGDVMISDPEGAYAELIQTEDQGSKLLIYIYDYSSYPYSVQTKIYGIPGNLMGTQDLLQKGNENVSNPFTLYPNPNLGNSTIRNKEGIFSKDAWLIIRDQSGIMISRTLLQEGSSEENLNMIDLPAGIYFYEVSTPFFRSKPARFVKL